MNMETTVPTYHVLLVGIDRYPPRYNSLWGCVNDIDAIERLLLEPPGVGIPSEHIRITRLASEHMGQPSLSRFCGETLAPTKANVVRALKALAGPTIKPFDRVLIFYSGHGDEKLWVGSSVWHEALVLHNDHDIEYLFDVEINALINRIAERTTDLTIILDCCHSAGATRDFIKIKAQGAVRSLNSSSTPTEPPDLLALGLDNSTQVRTVGSHLLQSFNPDYFVAVACQSDEKAGEGAYPSGQSSHGVFTYSLLNVLSNKDVVQRTELRWADIWPTILVKVEERNKQLNQRKQHPWIIGRSERRLFGGPWEKMDVGYCVTQRSSGNYEISAGHLMGVTQGAEIAVYGPTPRTFPPIGSPQDQPVGRLQVTQSGPSSAIAIVSGQPFVMLQRMRGRLVKPGKSERLRVSLKIENVTLKAQLEESPLIEIVSATAPDADVEIIAQSNGRWIIGNDTEALLAVVPAGESQTLRIGLEHYYRYNTVLHMARNCNEPQLSHSLSIRLLDCNDTVALNTMSPEEKSDPNFPEAPRDDQRTYRLQTGFKFCIKVINNAMYNLHVTLLNCSAGGLVEYLSDAIVREGASQVIWLDGKLGIPFETGIDELPTPGHGISVPSFVTDRLIAIGTTRRDIDLHYLTLSKTLQEVVNESLSNRTGGKRPLRPKKESIAPTELWTATVTPIRIICK